MTGDAADRLSAGDLSVGDEGPVMVVEDIERRDFVRYAGASGDFNPIHYDDTYARAAGNESVFGQGMLTAGYAATMAADWFGVENVTRLGVRFRARLWPGDTVTVTGEVTEVTADGRVTAELAVRNQDDEPLVTGEVEADLPA
jgi:acyl dehydratase